MVKSRQTKTETLNECGQRQRGVLGMYLGGIWETFGWYLEVKPTKKQPKTYQTFSAIFLIETPKRVLPKDSHYFLLDPINPFKGVTIGTSTCLLTHGALQRV